ncbi:MAG: hypothetical protein ACLFQV_11710 [Vulcanimicrobiota bacterium]
MNKIKFFLQIFTIALISIFINSCSGGRADESTPNQGASQVEMLVAVEGTGKFTTNTGYEIELEQGRIFLQHLEFSPGENSEDDDHGHEHILETGQKHEHDHDLGPETGIHLEGPYEVDLTLANTDLGYHNANPGTYTSFSYYIHPPAEHNHATRDKHEHSLTSLQMEGHIKRENKEYHMHLELPMEKLLTREVNLELEFGKYKRAQLVLELRNWFTGINFESADIENGELHINHDENKILADQIEANIIQYNQLHILEDE